jgi:hypothetical protein
LHQAINLLAQLRRRPQPCQEVEQRLWLQAEIARFQEAWPPGPATQPMPPFDWAELERQLTSLATSPATAALVPPLVSASRKRAEGKPPEMVLREVLVLAGIVQDENFQPGPLEPETDGEEFPMP